MHNENSFFVLPSASWDTASGNSKIKQSFDTSTLVNMSISHRVAKSEEEDVRKETN